MPVVHVFMLEGRTEEQKTKFIAEVSLAAERTVNAKPESVRVIITDVPKANFGIAGKSAKELGR